LGFGIWVLGFVQYYWSFVRALKKAQCVVAFRGTDGEIEEGQAYLSAEHPPPGEDPWLPGSDVNEEWPHCVEAAAREGA
jgi:hypothetical protein